MGMVCLSASHMRTVFIYRDTHESDFPLPFFHSLIIFQLCWMQLSTPNLQDDSMILDLKSTFVTGSYSVKFTNSSRLNTGSSTSWTYFYACKCIESVKRGWWLFFCRFGRLRGAWLNRWDQTWRSAGSLCSRMSFGSKLNVISQKVKVAPYVTI